MLLRLGVFSLVLALGGVLLGALAATRCCSSSRAVGRAQLARLQTALEMYRADERRDPVGSPRLDDDDAPWLFAALLCPPALGGGSRGPYLHWRPTDVGLLQTGVGAPLVRPLSADEQARLRDRDPEFLRAHGPESTSALVLLDPWGRPIHGRSWARLRDVDRDRLEREPWLRGPFDDVPAQPDAQAPIAHVVEDRPHDRGWDLWCDGANGVNEYGAPCSDDVTSWSPERLSCACRPAWVPAPTRGGAGLVALTGALGVVGGLGAARRRRSRRVTKPARLDVRTRSAPGRCAFCHASDRRSPLLACTGCGAGLHLDCWHDAGACPTLGCA